MKKRGAIWEELKGLHSCEVLILGGGINGAAVLRDLALQGVQCVLVDKADFCAGASSASSRMIHGGLRYLENAEFKLVSEAVRERNQLLKYAPHFVFPLRTTIPIMSWFGGFIKSPMVFFGLPVTPGGRGALIVKIGLSFYDFITGKRRQTPRHFLMSKQKSLSEIPGLKTNIVCTANYWDAWISQAERFCFDMIDEAVQQNPKCIALNYATVTKSGNNSVQIKDEISGETISLKPGIVVNATGAWIDMANRMLGLESRFMGGTKGSHLVIDNKKLYDALGDRMVYYEHDDGRICITFRFMNRVIMGSTDIRVNNPDEAECEDREIDYMMKTLCGVFPGLNLSKSDIVYTFCGVRPLPASGLDYTSRVPRSHFIKLSEPDEHRSFPIYSMVGGKLTTFRSFAEQTSDILLAELGKSRKTKTEKRYFYRAEGFPNEEGARKRWIERVAAENGLEYDRVSCLLDRYGTTAEVYAKQKDPSWRTPLRTLPEYTVGEIGHIAQNECIQHLSDLVRRRSIITLLGQANEQTLEELAGIVGSILGWNSQQQQNEINMALKEARGRR